MASEKELFSAVDQLLRDAEAPDAQRIAGPDNADEFRRQLAERLKAIGKSAPQVESGGAKVVVAGTSVPISSTAWSLTVCVVAIAAASLDPSGLTYGAASGAIIAAVDKLRDVIHRLDPAEQVVCQAVMEIAKDNKANGNEPEASLDEIKAHFKKRDEEIPVELDDIMSDLVKKSVLTRRHLIAGSYYRVTF
jgi:hypothetical protein